MGGAVLHCLFLNLTQKERNMKRLAFVLLLAATFVLIANAQRRTIGTDRGGSSSTPPSNERPSRSEESHPVDNTPAPAPPTHPCPPILVDRPTYIVLPPQETVVIIEHRKVKEEPEVNEVVLRENNVEPNRSGFDFSSEEVVGANDKAVDVYFSMSKEGPEFVVEKDADIQDLGQIDSFFKLTSVPSSEWSSMHRAHVQQGNVYIVWTWDNQYYKFRVVSISDNRVSIEWMKMDGGSRIASSISYRNGATRRDNSLAKFGK